MRPAQSSSGSHGHDLVRLASVILSESFRALHSTVESDHSVLSSVRTAWPQVLLELDDYHQVSPQARTYTPVQIKRAERYCDAFVRMRRSHHDKQITLDHVLAGSPPWRETSRRFGVPWTYCRSTHDDVLVAFYYVVAELEGLESTLPRARPRAA